MIKHFWLTLIMGFICFASVAQQANDSATIPQTLAVGGSPLFSNFSCTIKDFNKVLLQWTMDSADNNDYFVVERGKDTGHFETVGVLKRTDASTQYDLTDNNPSSASNYYRIKCTDSAGLIIYSRVLQIRLSGNAGFKFYPNPVDKLLIIEIGHLADLQIINSAGAVLINKQLQTGVQIINVSALERGEYVLRVADRESNHVVFEHLLKN
jgi:hypothetical protein